MRTHTAIRTLPALFVLFAAMATAQPPAEPGWKEVDRLLSEDKYGAASRLVAEIRARAQAAGDERDWTRALIEESLMRTALHGYETAVRFLKDEPWPPAPRYRLVLELFYAQALTTYVQGYSWEIRQRERVTSTDEVDLKAWTLDQIYGEAQRAYLEAWAGRDAWDDGSLGDLAEFFVDGNYPAHVRGTLRDAVTYLDVELLADTSLWRPEHSNEIFRLDLEALLAVGSAADVDLAAADVHPLRKIAAVLGDLESWHRSGQRPEAAFEARLERLRRLWASFDQDDDRARLRADLTAHLGELGRRYPWWSTGMATLAEFLREGDAPDRLQRARKIALDGEQAHPDSPGGRRCRHLVEVIEQPAFGVASMASDGAGQRSLQVSHKNLPALHFRAYALDLAATAEGARDYNLLPDYRDVPAILEGRRPDAEWSVELPATPDYLQHDTYVTPPLERPSLYLVVASARRDFAAAANQRTALPLVVSDLVLVRKDFAAPALTVRSGSAGEALAGVDVSLYRYDWQKGHAKVGTSVTDAVGDARFKDAARNQHYFAIARRGAEVALLQSFYVGEPSPPQQDDRALVYTDRSIYRPGQTILWKAVAYRRHAEHGHGRFSTLDGAALTVTLRDANHQEVASAAVTTNEFGTASGELAIPPGRLLGHWLIETSIPGSSSVVVEEYKRPTFEVTVDEPEEPLRLNRPATLGGEVRYYFGLPVTSGEVVWRVTREPVWTWWWYREPPAVSTQTIAAGTAILGEDGRFSVTFTPEADERLAGDRITYRYRLAVDVTDDGGETRSASRAFHLGFVAVEAQVVDPPGFFLAGAAAGLTLKRQDLDGAPRPGKGRWRLVELAQPAAPQLPADLPRTMTDGDEGFHTPGDLLRPRWEAGYTPRAVLRDWDDGAERAGGGVEHGEGGEARVELPMLGPGAWRLHYATDDAFGATFEIRYEFLVVGKDERTPLALAALLEVERASVPVGGVVRLAVHSGFGGQEMELVVGRGGGRQERRRLQSRPGVQLIEIPVERGDRGGLGFSLAVLRDHQLMTLGRQVFVPWDDRELQVEFATFRDKMRPGESETWTVSVKGHDGKALAAGAAELLAYMYDRSLDLFAPHAPFDPLTLYPSSVHLPGPQSNLGQASPVWGDSRGFAPVPGYPTLRGERLKSYDGYGLGGLGRRFGRTFRGGSPRVERMAAAPAAEAFQSADMAIEEKTSSAPPLPPSPPQEPAPPQSAGTPPRSDFSETAFWKPHLVLGEGGAVSFQFTVPESLTEWNVWVHALTRDLKAGRLERQVKTAKELMVRPYLPRFLRQGDRAEIRVLVQNAGEKALTGTLDFDVRDPETDESLLAEFGLAAEDARGRSFTVEPGGSADLSFPLAAPARLGTVAFEAVARAGDFSDGELRPLPVLPSRVHLAQSRFVTLRDRDRRALVFDDLARGEDPTRLDELLVVTLDAQLFYGVLSALPYLVNYPYECTEQTLNRFLSTGIVSSLYDEYPAVARMAAQLSQRETRFEPWDAADPNRKMALEETPWLVTARGGGEAAEDLVNVLDPKIAAAQRAASLEKLRQAQTAVGGFPWWPGGPPSPYMTVYLLDGFSRALEFDVDVPQDVVTRAWSYLHSHYVDEIARRMVAEDCCWQIVTYLNYVLSSYPDPSWTGDVFTADDREKMLEHSLRHWRRHSPRLKAYLALTLHRMERGEEARTIFDSILDSAKTTRDEGTFWAPEERAWLWYNDTIESHAFVLRALLEMKPDDAMRHGLVQWLFLNKHLSHWKSTRATAEVIYSLVHYLEGEGTLGVREEATVTMGPRVETFTWEPDRYTGKDTRIVVAGEDVERGMATIEVSKETPGFLFASATWHFSTEELPEEGEGDFFAVARSYFRRVHDGREWVLEPLQEGAEIAVGDQLEVQLSLRSKHAAEYVHLRDPRGAGFEPETATSRHQWDLGIRWYEEVRDSGTNFFFDWLPVGEYTFKYRLRANVAGTFRVGPATVQSMYAPEFVAYSSGAELGIVP